jgi:hypothetical protein
MHTSFWSVYLLAHVPLSPGCISSSAAGSKDMADQLAAAAIAERFLAAGCISAP